MTEAATDPRAALCDRLAEMRAAIVAGMIESGFSAGAGALLAQIGAAMDAIKIAPGSPPAHESAEGCAGTKKSLPLPPAPAVRAVLADDGEAMRLILYGDGPPVAAALDPVRAVGLAGEIIAAAHRRLAR